MKLKKLAIILLSAGLVMSLRTGSVMSGAEIVHDDDSTEASITFDRGEISIEEVSASIAFERNKVSTSGESYKSTETIPTFITVNDERGTGEGWRLTANAGNFKEEGKDTLPGADIILKNGEITPEEAVTERKTQTPTITKEIVLKTGADIDGTEEIVKAVGNTTDISNAQGVGRWKTEWLHKEDSEVELRIPSRSASAGNHTAIITWTLTNDPTTTNKNNGSGTDD